MPRVLLTFFKGVGLGPRMRTKSNIIIYPEQIFDINQCALSNNYLYGYLLICLNFISWYIKNMHARESRLIYLHLNIILNRHIYY